LTISQLAVNLVICFRFICRCSIRFVKLGNDAVEISVKQPTMKSSSLYVGLFSIYLWNYLPFICLSLLWCCWSDEWWWW